MTNDPKYDKLKTSIANFISNRVTENLPLALSVMLTSGTLIEFESQLRGNENHVGYVAITGSVLILGPEHLVLGIRPILIGTRTYDSLSLFLHNDGVIAATLDGPEQRNSDFSHHVHIAIAQ